MDKAILAKNYSSLKRAETRNYKRFPKINLPNVGMMHWLTKYTNKDAHSTTLLHFTQPSLHK